MATEGEWERLIANAQKALANGEAAQFEIDGYALAAARARQLDLARLRVSILAEAFRQYLDDMGTAQRPSNGG